MIAVSFLVACATHATFAIKAVLAAPDKKPSSPAQDGQVQKPATVKTEKIQTGSMLTDFGDLRDQNDKDRQLCDRARYGTNVDHWYKAVEKGDRKSAKTYWRAVLNELKGCRRIWFLLLDLRLRWCLSDEDVKIDHHDYAFHKNLIADTEEAVGKEHRFVADVLTFCGTYFETSGKSEDALKAYSRTLEIRTKSLGNDATETVSIKFVLAEYLYKLKRYAESEHFFKEFAASCQKLKEREALLDGVRRYAATMRRVGRVKDAYAVEAKYGLMMSPK